MVRHVRNWTLWTRPKSVICYVLVVDIAVVAGMTFAGLNSDAPAGVDWFRFGILMACVTLHLQLSRRQEERRRNLMSNVHVELTAIWIFPAVLVLPIQLTMLLLIAVRVQRWFIARRPPYRFLFSTASVMSAALVTRGLLDLVGPRAWSELGGFDSLQEFSLMLATGLVYTGVQVVVIGVIAALNSPPPTVRKVLGSKEDNELEAATIALGMVSAILLVNLPPALVIMVAISVIGNRIAEVRQLQEDARTDPKTGLLNMRGWHEGATRALARADRANSSAALLMIDLDYFKSINDTWGHPAGDDMLVYVAHSLRNVTRPGDVVGRFGGEEFVLMLPDMDVDEAMAAGERVRRTISDLHVPTTDKRGGPVAIRDRTTSVGVAVFPDHAAGLDDLLQVADAAVYEAKENGRDQVRLGAARNNGTKRHK